MSWHTSIILIQEPRPAELGDVLDRLGFAHGEAGETISFEDATSSHAPGKSVGHVAGWSVICDPQFFLSREALGLAGNQLWSKPLDKRLKAISKGGAIVFGLISEGATSTHGFTLYRNGKCVRMWISRGREISVNKGELLPEEVACFHREQPFAEEQGLLMLMEKIAVPLLELQETRFQVFHAAPDVDETMRLLQAPNPPPESIPVLIALVRNANWFVAVQAASALSRMTASAVSAIPVLVERLDSKDENIRGCMARALGEFGPLAVDAVPNLINLLNDKGRCWYSGKPRCLPVRFLAAFALARIAPERDEFIPLLREALHYNKKPDPTNVLALAIEVITKHLGEKAQLFVPDLQTDDEDKDLNLRIRKRLSKLMALAQIVPGYALGEEQVRRAYEGAPNIPGGKFAEEHFRSIYQMVKGVVDAEIASRLSTKTGGGSVDQASDVAS